MRGRRGRRDSRLGGGARDIARALRTRRASRDAHLLLRVQGRLGQDGGRRVEGQRVVLGVGGGRGGGHGRRGSSRSGRRVHHGGSGGRGAGGGDDGGVGLGRAGGAADVLDDLEPLLGVGGGVRLEGELGVAGELAGEGLALVLALDVELLARGRADDGVGEVDGELGLGVLAGVVAVLELVEELAGGDDVVARGVAKGQLVARLALEGALDERLGGLVVHVGEVDGVDGAGRVVGVGEAVGGAGGEVGPLEALGDALDGAEDVVVQGADLIRLAAAELVEGAHGLLEDLDDVGLERLKVVLHRDEVVGVVVLGEDLVGEAVHDATVDDVGVLGAGEAAARGVVRGRLLAEQLNLLLRRVAQLLHLLGARVGARVELLGLVLDLLVQALEDGEHGALDALLRLEVGVDHGLRVGAQVLEEAGDAAQRLVKVVSLAQRVGDGLEHLFVLLGVAAVDLLHGAHVVLEVADGVLPRLEALGEQAGGLRVLVDMISHVGVRSVSGGNVVEGRLTVVGSRSGTASSRLMPVAVREGRVVETGEAMAAVV